MFWAHSTRSVPVSNAAVSASADVIVKTAGWSSKSTFCKYYKKPVATTDRMSKAVLQTASGHG